MYEVAATRKKYDMLRVPWARLEQSRGRAGLSSAVLVGSNILKEESRDLGESPGLKIRFFAPCLSQVQW